MMVVRLGAVAQILLETGTITQEQIDDKIKDIIESREAQPDSTPTSDATDAVQPEDARSNEDSIGSGESGVLPPAREGTDSPSIIVEP